MGRPGRIPAVVIGIGVVRNLLPPPVIVAPPSTIVVESPPVVVAPPPTVVSPAPDPVVATPPAPQGNTTAIQIVELGRGGAARAGLQVGDIIITVDGVRTRTFDDLRAVLVKSNGTSEFVFYNPDSQAIDNRQVAVANGLIGASVVEVPVDLDPSFDQPAAQPGQLALQVTAVDRGGAGRAGILVGDLILGVDGKWLASEADLTRALAASKGESEVTIYNPDTAKAENRKVSVTNGSIGVTVQAVPIEVKN